MPEKALSEQHTTGDQPKIYVTSKGARYVKADELLRSKRAREQIKALAKLDFSRPQPDTTSKSPS